VDAVSASLILDRYFQDPLKNGLRMRPIRWTKTLAATAAAVAEEEEEKKKNKGFSEEEIERHMRALENELEEEMPA